VPFSPSGNSSWITFYTKHAVEQAELTGDLAAAFSKPEDTPRGWRWSCIVFAWRLGIERWNAPRPSTRQASGLGGSTPPSLSGRWRTSGM
jgi:hypothetical protein